MTKTSTLPSPIPERVTIVPAGALPVIKALLEELGVSEIIDALVPNPTGEYAYGALASVVIASRLQGVPVPIYEVADWAAATAVPQLFGIPAEKLNDDRLGGMLDALRPQRRLIWSWVIGRAIKRFGIEVRALHADPTKIAFEGSYAGQEALPADVPRLAYGKPKDGQVDRLLLTLSALVSEDGGLPIWFGLGDGNEADDTTYLDDLRELRAHLPLDDVLVLGGDSKLPSHENLLGLCRWGYQVVATEPWRAVRRERLAKLWQQGARWAAVAYVAEADRHKPVAERGRYEVILEPDTLADPQTGKTYALRRLYVRSSRKAEQTAAKRAKHLAAMEAELERIQRLLNKYDYTTLDVVRARVAKAVGKYPVGRCLQTHVSKTRATTAPIHLTWSVNQKQVAAEAQWDGVYSVITNLPAETHDPTAVLEIYKDQHLAEGRFRDLNQLPVRVRPLWLKRPDRIETLTFLVMLAAFVFALLERQVRRFVAEQGTPLTGLMPEKRDTLHPTAKRLLLAFVGMGIVKIEDARGTRWRLGELTSIQRQVIAALGLADLATYFPALAVELRQGSSPAQV